jgi:hypothetical protein
MVLTARILRFASVGAAVGLNMAPEMFQACGGPEVIKQTLYTSSGFASGIILGLLFVFTLTDVKRDRSPRAVKLSMAVTFSVLVLSAWFALITVSNAATLPTCVSPVAPL